MSECRARVEQIIAKLEKAIGEYASWLYFKGQMGGDPVPPRECNECDYRKVYEEIRSLCRDGATEYLCLRIGELREMVRGRVEDVITLCWEKYANAVCYRLPFISHIGLAELVDTLAKLNVTHAAVKTLDGVNAVIDIVNDAVCIGVE